MLTRHSGAPTSGGSNMKLGFVSAIAAMLMGGGLLAGQQASNAWLNGPNGEAVDVLPDMVPMWAPDSLQDIRIDRALTNDRLVSCNDWTAVDPTPITGQRVL